MKKRMLFTVGLMGLLACAVQAGQEQLAASIRQTRAEATATHNQLETTLSALSALVAQKTGDLRPAFNAFQAEIPKTEMAAATTRARVESMAKNGGTYFKEWQKTVDSISNKSLQKKAQKRLDAASLRYNKVEAAFVAASEKFRPFLSDLTDVQKTLSHDVTAAGVKSAKSTVRSANWNYKAVASSINEALSEMQKMEKALSAEAT